MQVTSQKSITKNLVGVFESEKSTESIEQDFSAFVQARPEIIKNVVVQSSIDDSSEVNLSTNSIVTRSRSYSEINCEVFFFPSQAYKVPESKVNESIQVLELETFITYAKSESGNQVLFKKFAQERYDLFESNQNLNSDKKSISSGDNSLSQKKVSQHCLTVPVGLSDIDKAKINKAQFFSLEDLRSGGIENSAQIKERNPISGDDASGKVALLVSQFAKEKNDYLITINSASQPGRHKSKFDRESQYRDDHSLPTAEFLTKANSENRLDKIGHVESIPLQRERKEIWQIDNLPKLKNQEEFFVSERKKNSNLMHTVSVSSRHLASVASIPVFNVAEVLKETDDSERNARPTFVDAHADRSLGHGTSGAIQVQHKTWISSIYPKSSVLNSYPKHEASRGDQSMDVTVKANPDSFEISFTSGNKDTLELLTRYQADLRNALRKGGVEDFNLSFNSGEGMGGENARSKEGRRETEGMTFEFGQPLDDPTVGAMDIGLDRRV